MLNLENIAVLASNLPAYKRPPSQLLPARWRSLIYEAYSILSGLSRAAAFQPMLHQFRSVAARFAGAIADNGTDPDRFPSPFQSGCKSRCWPVHHRTYWQTAVLPAHHKWLNAALGTVDKVSGGWSSGAEQQL